MWRGSSGCAGSSPCCPGLNDYRAILHAHAEDSAHTGGTRPEMLAEAKRAGVHAILLTRPPPAAQGLHHRELARTEGRRPLHPRVRGPRVPALSRPAPSWTGWPSRFPSSSRPSRADGGLIFLSHIEERPDHPMDGPRWHGDLQPPCRRQEGRGGSAGVSPQADLAGLCSAELQSVAPGLSRRAVRRPGRVSRRLPGQVGPGDRHRAGSRAWPPTIAITTWS